MARGEIPLVSTTTVKCCPFEEVLKININATPNGIAQQEVIAVLLQIDVHSMRLLIWGLLWAKYLPQYRY